MSLQSKPVTFKEVWSTNTRTLHINPHWTITQFIETIRQPISSEFYVNDFEIVETGQDLLGIPAEDAPCLEKSDIKLKQKWGPELNVSFYVRRKNHIYPELQNYYLRLNGINVRNDVNNPLRQTECPVCFEITALVNRYSCSHGICNMCFHRCRESNFTNCPLCRYN
jgi:hypothetical protein